MSNWIGIPLIWVKRSLVQKLLSEHTHMIDYSIWITKVENSDQKNDMRRYVLYIHKYHCSSRCYSAAIIAQ